MTAKKHSINSQLILNNSPLPERADAIHLAELVGLDIKQATYIYDHAICVPRAIAQQSVIYPLSIPYRALIEGLLYDNRNIPIR